MHSLHTTWGIFGFPLAMCSLSLYIVYVILSFFHSERCVCYNLEFIDVSFRTDVFTWPLPYGLSGFTGSKSSVFKCRNGWTTTTINKQRRGFRHLSRHVRFHFLNFHKKYPEIFHSVFVRNEHELQVILSWLWRFPSSVCFCEVRLPSVPIPWNANPVKLCISKMWRKDISRICATYSVSSYRGFGIIFFSVSTTLAQTKSIVLRACLLWSVWFAFLCPMLMS